MEEQANKERREEIFSRAVRAGKRTYFFDVKATRSDEYYLTITESKRRFNSEQGKFYYEKHKLFLYKEDFEKFANGLNDVIEFIETGKEPEQETPVEDKHTDVEFEDLGKEEKKTSE
ncbi:MAG: PUR family DNA/RNA-binding protein [Bacteroidales bacterium]|nr:PUR family DNA/RNA-binding protein [Bacteroidales bacterium]